MAFIFSVAFLLAFGEVLLQATEIQTSDVNSFGYNAGTTGSSNSFFGLNAGAENTTGTSNSFFGSNAGASNSEGFTNSFFGDGAGKYNTTGYNNSFFGDDAGQENTNGVDNSFYGARAGGENTTGASNSFFGARAGEDNQTGIFNAFFGDHAGQSNTVESGNTLIGAYSKGAADIINGTAIGYRSLVARSNSLILGSVNGINGAAAEINVGIGITSPDRQLTVEGTQAVGRLRRYYGTAEPFTRTFAPTFLLERSRGTQATPANIQADDYLGKVQFRGMVGGTAIEYGAMAFIATDTSQNGRFAFLDRDISTERVSILNTGNVGINTIAPLERLHVVGNVRIDGDLLWTDPGASVPDYVFNPGYKLMGIDELEKFIARERHLPNIPAAIDIKDQGLNMSDFQMKLLEKIEELTLYTVQQAKTIRLKDAQIAELDARMALLERMMERLAKQPQ
jgi:trimeric autotransporter adhesin